MYKGKKKREHTTYNWCVEHTQNSTRIVLRSHRALRLLIIFCSTTAIFCQSAYSATQVSQYGITWTFDKDYTTGQFANGDYWIVGPVNIINISPGWDGEKHGSMINPDPGNRDSKGEYLYQALDSRRGYFDSSLLKEAPFTLEPNSSLVSVISWIAGEPGCPPIVDGIPRPLLKTAAVLTALDSIPPNNGATVFRPPYAGSNKPLYSTTNLRKELLANLGLVAGTPNISDIANRFERVWLDLGYHGDGEQYMCPSKNMPVYGRDISTLVGDAALLLMLYEQGLVTRFGQNKDTLLMRFVQTGIDYYGVAENGGRWWGAGGLNSGRKWPILFAGLLLDHSGMKNIGTLSQSMAYGGFAEDCQTFYVNSITLEFEAGGYTVDDIGLPEWSSKTYCYNQEAYKEWATSYRDCCTAQAWVGFVLAAHICNAKSLWNHDALFDYQDRFMEVQLTTGGTRCQDDFAEQMWDTYRADYGCVWTRYNADDIYSNGYNPCTSDTVPPLPPTNLVSDGQTESSISLSWTAPGIASDGDPASRYRIYRDGTPVDIVTEISFEDTGLSAETSYTYNVYSLDDAGNQSVSAATGTFSTSSDTTPPSIVSISASETSVEITFSEPLDTISAEQIDNYSINNGILVTASSLNTKTVTLTTSVHTEGTYTLTVNNVKDTSGNSMTETIRDYEYDDGLVGHWKFDDGSGSSAIDSSGNNNTGTLINGPTWTAGKIDGALSFDGIDDAVQIGTSNLNVSGGTIALWAYADNFPSTTIQYIFGHVTQAWANRIQLYTDDISGNLDLGLGDSHTRHSNIQDLNTNTWYHIGLTWNGTNYVVFINGAAKATGSYTGLSSLETYADIGNDGYSSDRSEAFSGIIDEVRIYDRALSTADVLELYNAGTTHDTNSPNISNVIALNVTASGATITWDTDESSTSQVEYGTDTSYGSSTTLDTNLIISHSVALAGLSPATTYHFRVKSRDSSGNESASQDNTFTTESGVTVHTLMISSTSGGTVTNPGEDLFTYDHGSEVSIEATAAVHYHFVNWTGTAVSAGKVANPSATSTTVTMDADYAIRANFSIDQHTLTISSTSGGTVTNPGEGTFQYNYGAVVSIEATAADNYRFVNWTGTAVDAGKVANPGAASTTVLMGEDYAIQANFVIDEIDVTAPTVTNTSPQANTIQVPLNTLVTLNITDSGHGVDADSVTIEANGHVVYTGNTAKYSGASGECYRTGTAADYEFIYQSNEKFDFDQSVNVTVNASDLAGNTMDEYSYSFQTEMRSFGKNIIVDSDDLTKGGPVTVRDSSGNIWVAWHAGMTGNKDIYISKLTAGSGTFGNSIKLTDSTADQRNPAIAVGTDDKLYVTWQDSRNGNWDIYVSTSTDGVNFSAETRVTDSNDNQINPAITVDSSLPNNVYIVWEDSRNGNQDIYIGVSNNGFVSTTTSQITSELSYQGEPAIAVDSDKTVYVVWTDRRNSGKNDIYGAASDKSWANIPVVTQADSQSSPAIATEDVGSILHLVWTDDRSGDEDIYYAKTTEGLPTSPLSGSSIIDDTTNADQKLPVIAVAGSTGSNLRVYVCWEDERNGDDDLYLLATNSGSGTNIFVGDDGTNTDQTEPAIGTDGYGQPYLVWLDGRNMNTDIYYAGSTFIEAAVLASGIISTSSAVTVGTPVNAIDSIDDVSVEVPKGAFSCEIEISISKVKNPQISDEYLSIPYEFGPSGIKFDLPVTITIPYEFPVSDHSAKAYWRNTLTGLASQEGITELERIKIASKLYALRFKTTHFTQFFIVGSSNNDSNGISVSGGGGCSMSPDSHAGAAELLLPYIGLAVAMVILKLRDRRKRKTCNTT